MSGETKTNYCVTDHYTVGDTTFALGRHGPDYPERFAVWQFKKDHPSEKLQEHRHDTQAEAMQDYCRRIEKAVITYSKETGKPYPLPLLCMGVEPSTGMLINIRLGLNGYFGSDWNRSHDLTYNRETADFANQRMGVTKAQESAMLHGSMFGWDCKAADPRCYDEQGKVIPSNKKGKNHHER